MLNPRKRSAGIDPDDHAIYVNHFFYMSICIVMKFIFNFYMNVQLEMYSVRHCYVKPLITSIRHTVLKICCVISTIGTPVASAQFWLWAHHLSYEAGVCNPSESVELQSSLFYWITFASLAQSLWFAFDLYSFKDLDIMKRQVFLAVFITACHFLKCTKFALVLSYAMIISEIDTVSQITYILSKHNGSPSLMKVSKWIFGFSLCGWCFIFMYVYPAMLIMKTTSMMDFPIIAFYGLAVIHSPFARLVASYVLSPYDRPKRLAYYLFGTDPFLRNITGSERSFIVENEIIMTVRGLVICRNGLMRRVRRIRERKRLESLLRDRMRQVAPGSVPRDNLPIIVEDS